MPRKVGLVGSRRLRDFIESCRVKFGDMSKAFSMEEAFAVMDLYRPSAAKFDESVDVCVKLGTDPKRTEQSIKVPVLLPNGNGKKPSILCFVEGDLAESCLKEGAKYAGLDDMLDQIVSGSLVPGRDFTNCVATPDTLVKISKSKAVKILGVAGMMPNVKVGTVTRDPVSVLKEFLSGRILLKNDKSGSVKVSAGRISFAASQITENIMAIYEAVKSAKPAGFKGSLFKSIEISTSMMPFCLNLKMSEFYEKN